jgi:molybdopterin-guanine dinucleotide biosynthesis protein A
MPSPDFTGVLLAGGQSRRFGSNKALAQVGGCRLIERPAGVLARLFRHLLLVTNTPQLYSFLDWPMVPDLLPGAGPLAGIQAALHHTATPYIFVAGCDMPALDPELIAFLCARAAGYDVVLPVNESGPEPLHAVYSRSALPGISAALAAGVRKIQEGLGSLRVLEIGPTALAGITAAPARSFSNINTTADLPREES